LKGLSKKKYYEHISLMDQFFLESDSACLLKTIHSKFLNDEYLQIPNALILPDILYTAEILESKKSSYSKNDIDENFAKKDIEDFSIADDINISEEMDSVERAILEDELKR